MTDDDDDLQALRHQLFGPPNPNPITPGRITLDEITAFSRDWQRRRGITDADVVTDPDGLPIYVSESHPVLCAGLAISQADADRLGITPGQHPGIHIITNREEATK